MTYLPEWLKGRTFAIVRVGEDLESTEKTNTWLVKNKLASYFGKLISMKAKHIQKHSRISSC